jgi:hypothetical protein
VGRLRDFGKDAACYFGVGEGSERSRACREPEENESDLELVLRIAPPLVVTLALRRVLGIDDDLSGT